MLKQVAIHHSEALLMAEAWPRSPSGWRCTRQSRSDQQTRTKPARRWLRARA